MESIFRSADVFVFPSVSEGFALVLAEAMACGLPCVDLAGFSAESVFGEDGPVSLSEFSVLAIADQMEMLIEDQALWDQRSRRGMEFAANHSWEAAAVEVEAGLREALRDRERLLPGANERS